MHRSAEPRRIAALTVLASTVAAGAVAQEATRPSIGLADLARIARVVDVCVSPDGSSAVATVTRVHGDPLAQEGETGYRSHLLWLDLDGEREPRWLTSGERAARSPAYRPDGGELAFVRLGEVDEDSDERRPQVWLLPLDGPGEARQLTDLEHGAGAPRWTPDGRHVFVRSNLPLDELEGEPAWETERVGGVWPDPPEDASDDGSDAEARDEPEAIDPDAGLESLRSWLGSREGERDPSVFSRLAFQDETALRGDETVAHLYSVDAGTGEATSVLGGFHDPGSIAIAPDGTIAYSARPPGDEHPDRVWRSVLWRLDPGAEEPRVLLDDAGWSFEAPLWSDDGAVLFFVARDASEPLYSTRRAASWTRADGSWRVLTEDLDANVTELESDGGVLCFRAYRAGSVRLHGLDLESGTHREIVEVPGEILAYGFDGGEIVYAYSDPANPCEVFRLDAADADQRLTDLHASWLEGVALAVPRPASTPRPEGYEVQSWLMEPPGRAQDAKVPLVLSLHGGPHVQWGPGTHTMWHEWQLLCAHGYAVLFVNPRGSDGYGEAFRRANHKDWGSGPAGDALAALDQALAANEWIDRDHLYVTGGSYAGYLTAWIVCHTDRFRAAVAQRGVYDLRTFFGEGNAWRLVEWAFGGFPWEPETARTLEHESPITHVASCTTPLLIMHASSDLRTGVSQSEQLYRSLKELRRPVEYVRYPDAGHDLSRTGDPRQRVDRLGRILEFFAR